MAEIENSMAWFRGTGKMRLDETVHIDTPERHVVTRQVPLGVVRVMLFLYQSDVRN